MGKSKACVRKIGINLAGLARGNRGGMLGKITRGTWETLDIGYVKGVGEVRSSDKRG